MKFTKFMILGFFVSILFACSGGEKSSQSFKSNSRTSANLKSEEQAHNNGDGGFAYEDETGNASESGGSDAGTDGGDGLIFDEDTSSKGNNDPDVIIEDDTTGSGEINNSDDSSKGGKDISTDEGESKPGCNYKNIVWSTDGFMEHTSESAKPAMAGSDSACQGKNWVNGGSAKGWGTATETIDWNLNPKIGYEERGHSITRTVLFNDPPEDAQLSLRIHRWRFASESYGVKIWMHWDKRVTWSGSALNSFRALADYTINCSFTKADSKYVCSWNKSDLTLDDCSKAKGSCREYEQGSAPTN